MLDDVVTKSVCEDLSWQRRYCNSRALSFQYISKVLEIGIAAPDRTVFELECGDIGTANDFVVSVHAA